MGSLNFEVKAEHGFNANPLPGADGRAIPQWRRRYMFIDEASKLPRALAAILND